MPLALRKIAALLIVGLLAAGALVGCTSAQPEESPVDATKKSADFDRGSISVDGDRVTVTLADTAGDGYSWYATDAEGMTENLDAEAETDAVSGSAVRVYDVEASVEASMDFYYANESDPSDISYMDTLTVTADESGNVSAASIFDSEGGSASVSL